MTAVGLTDLDRVNDRGLVARAHDLVRARWHADPQRMLNVYLAADWLAAAIEPKPHPTTNREKARADLLRLLAEASC